MSQPKPYWKYVLELQEIYNISREAAQNTADVIWPTMTETHRYYYRTPANHEVNLAADQKRIIERKEQAENAHFGSREYTERLLAEHQQLLRSRGKQPRVPQTQRSTQAHSNNEVEKLRQELQQLKKYHELTRQTASEAYFRGLEIQGELQDAEEFCRELLPNLDSLVFRETL